MSKARFCKVCGFEVSKHDPNFGPGDICMCCGSEEGFSDDIVYANINNLFTDSLLQEVGITSDFIEKYLYEVMKLDGARKLLRLKWIRDGYKWRYESGRYKSESWDKEALRKQLLNINVAIEDYNI